MSTPEKKFNAAQLRLLQVVEILSGHEVFGLRLRDIATTLKIGDSTVLRDLWALEEGGWAQQQEDRWRLAAKPVQIAVNFAAGITARQQELTETQQRYTRTPK